MSSCVRILGATRFRSRHLALPLIIGATAVALAVVPAAASAAASGLYATNVVGSVTQFKLTSGGGVSFAGNASAGASPIGIAVSPDGKNVYSTNAGSNSISQFDAGVGGALVPQATPKVATGEYPFDVAVSPDGRSVYVTNGASDSVSEFNVGPGGALSPMTPATLAVGETPEGIAVSPDGKSVYVANAVSNSVSQFNVAPDGVLSPKPTPNVATGRFPVGIAISPDGRSVYVTNFDIDTVSQYDVGPGGALSPKSPATVATGTGPVGIAVSPSGRNVYVADRQRVIGRGTVSQYTAGTGGALTPKPIARIRTGVAPWGVAISPDGQSVYVAMSNPGSEQGVFYYDVSESGSLSSRGDVHGYTVRSLVVAPDQAPTASFTVNSSGAGSPSSFDASASTASEGRHVARYDWDFGDGSHEETTGPKVTHTYASPNTFTVTLTVTDDIGCSTRTVFTGHTASCHGTSAARTTRSVSVLGRGPGLTRVGRARSAGHLVLVPVSCVGRAACRLTLALTVIEKLRGGRVIGFAPASVTGAVSTRRVTLGRSTVTLRPGGHVTVRLRLGGTGVQLLHRFHRFTATLRAPRSLTAVDNQQLSLH